MYKNSYSVAYWRFVFRLNPYNCISMEYAVGMIEVVERSETVANIQKQSAIFNAASPLQKAALLREYTRRHDKACACITNANGSAQL